MFSSECDSALWVDIAYQAYNILWVAEVFHNGKEYGVIDITEGIF